MTCLIARLISNNGIDDQMTINVLRSELKTSRSEASRLRNLAQMAYPKWPTCKSQDQAK